MTSQLHTGFFVLELEILQELISDPELHAIARYIMQRTCNKLQDSFPSITMEVIDVEYVGKYPAIGLQGDAVDETVISTFRQQADKLIRTMTCEELIAVA